MGFRDTLNNNPAVVTAGAAVLLLLCLLLVVCQFTGGGGPVTSTERYLVYYDVSNQKIQLILAPYGEEPDSPLPDNPNAFEAAVLTCGEPDGGKLKDGMSLEELKAAGMSIGWISRRDPGTISEPISNPSYQSRTLDKNTWVQEASAAWDSEYTRIVYVCSGGGPASQVFPTGD